MLSLPYQISCFSKEGITHIFVDIDCFLDIFRYCLLDINYMYSLGMKNSIKIYKTGNLSLSCQPPFVHLQFEAESPHPHQSNMPSNGKVGESREDHSSRSAHSQTHEHLNPIVC